MRIGYVQSFGVMGPILNHLWLGKLKPPRLTQCSLDLDDEWEPYMICHEITGDGKEMRYNLLISSNGLVKRFLIKNASLWMLAVDHTYQVA